MSRFAQLLVLVCCLVFVGCGKETEQHSAGLGSGSLRWSAFPVEIRLDSLIQNDPDALADAQAAMAFWQQKAGKPLFVLGSPWPHSDQPYTGIPEQPDELLANVVFFQNPWAFAPSAPGNTIVHSKEGQIQNAVILLNDNYDLCANDCLSQNNEVNRRILIAHELGHLLGLGHSDDRLNVMFAEVQPFTNLNALQVDQGMLLTVTQ